MTDTLLNAIRELGYVCNAYYDMATDNSCSDPDCCYQQEHREESEILSDINVAISSVQEKQHG